MAVSSFLSGLWAHSRSYCLLGHAPLGLIDCGCQFHRPSRDHLQKRITSCRLRPIRGSSRWSLNIAIEKRQGSLHSFSAGDTEYGIGRL